MAKEGGCGTVIVLGIIGIALYSCSQKSPEKKLEAEQAVISGEAPAPTFVDSAAATANPVRADFDEGRATDAAHDYLTGETYESSQGGSSCTDECSGHEAGWQWAQDGNDCGDGSGSSESFVEGCEAYTEAVEEKVEEARTRYEGGEDTFAGN